MSIRYSTSQLKAIQTVNDWIANPKRPRHCILKAGAGRGKTFLLANMFSPNNGADYVKAPLSVVYTATTHVAIEQIIKQVQTLKDTPEVTTLHSFLQISPSTNTYLKQQRNPKQFKKSSYYFNTNFVNTSKQLIIVDEAYRMDKELYDILCHFHPNSDFLFLGDPYQTPPVGESVAYIDTIPDTDKVVYELQEAKRFKEGALSEVVENLLLATKYQEPKWAEVLPSKTDENNACWKSAKYMQNYVDVVSTYACPTHKFSIVCGTRKKADYFNKYIFDMRTKQKLPHVFISETPIYEYSFNFKKEGTKDFDAEELLTKFINNNMVPDADKRLLRVATLNTGDKKLIIIGDQGKGLSSKALAVLHGLSRAYNQIVYIFRMNIAKTVHTAQGITSHTVFVDMPSIARWYETDMKRRLTYTAASRASDNLYFVE